MSPDQITALAGMFQAGSMVREIARDGKISSPEAYQASLNSILVIDAPNTAAVYGGLANVRNGLQLLASLYTSETKARDMEITQYVLGIAHLERKLAKDNKMLNTMATGIERAQAQSQHFPIPHENIVSNLASIYVDTISTLQPRIVVSGEQGYLMQTENAEKVRALLLALMRSAVLWRQKGGRRWQFLFSRAAIMKEANRLLKTI